MFIVAVESPSVTSSEGLSSRTVKLSGFSVTLSALTRRDILCSVLPAGMATIVFIGS